MANNKYLLLHYSTNGTEYFTSESIPNLKAHQHQLGWESIDCVLLELIDSVYIPIARVSAVYAIVPDLLRSLNKYMAFYSVLKSHLASNFPASIRLM